MALGRFLQTPRLISIERAIESLLQQIDNLKTLSDRKFDDARKDEAKWQHLTYRIIKDAFGERSAELSKFCGAMAAGYHNPATSCDQQSQKNFELRGTICGALLEDLIDTLRRKLLQDGI